MQFSWRTFFLRALLIFLIALLPLALYALLTAAAPVNLKETAQRTAAEFDRLIGLRRQEVFAISAFPSIRAFAASTPEARPQRAAVALNELQSWVAADENVREAFIVDATGRVIMTTLEGWNADLSQRVFVQDALSGKLAVSPVARDRGEFSNYYAAPVLNNKGEIAGALVIRVQAQELWEVTPRGKTWYAVLGDENGVRLDDAGDPARRLASFAPLDGARAARIVQAQTYGAELLQPRATNLQTMQQRVTQGALDQIQPSDFNAGAVAARRLITVPWTVFLIESQPPLAENAARLVIPIFAALVLALGGAFLFQRL